MNLLIAILLGAPLDLPENGAVRWTFATADRVQSTGCNDSFIVGDEKAAIFNEVDVYVSRVGGKLDDVKLATPDCRRHFPQAEALAGLSKAASLETLRALAVDANASSHETELLTAAIAWHGGDGALQALRELSRLDDKKQWKPALFWLAGLGAAGRETVIGFLDDAHSEKHRRHALIVLALQGEGKAFEPIRHSALHDPLPDVRAEALFALALGEAPGAASFIETVARTDNAEVVRQRAIFALSQVGGDAAIDALIRIVRNTDFGEHRREAIFWLAQMDASRAGDIVEEMAMGL